MSSMSQRSTSSVLVAGCEALVVAIIAAQAVDIKPAAARVSVVGWNVELSVKLASVKDLMLWLVFS